MSPQNQRVRQKTSGPRISYHQKPDHLTIDEWQRELRRAFIKDKKQTFSIWYTEGEHPVFADYTVKNLSSGATCKVALTGEHGQPEKGII